MPDKWVGGSMNGVCVCARVQEQLDAERDARRRADEAVTGKGAQEEEARRRAEGWTVLQVWACQING